MRVQRYAGLTDTGRRRRRNEDSLVVRPPLFAVADGMGGPRAGEVASGLAAAAVKGDEAGGDGKSRVVSLIQEANRRVYQRSSEDAAVSGMGTTMTVAVVDDDGVTIGHVGDSRAYLVRDGSLDQLTEDHSLVSELVRAGKLSPEEAVNHPQRSVITRALGTDPDVDVDVFTVTPQDGDVFLLCSDGLTTMVSDEAIADALAKHAENLDRAAKELVRLANKAGGEDNITVIAFQVTDEPAAEPIDETKPMPAVSDAYEDDTLDESDRVPAVTTMVVAPVAAAGVEAGSPEPPAPRKRRGWIVTLVLFLLLVAGAAVALWFLAQ